MTIRDPHTNLETPLEDWHPTPKHTYKAVELHCTQQELAALLYEAGGLSLKEAYPEGSSKDKSPWGCK